MTTRTTHELARAIDNATKQVAAINKTGRMRYYSPHFERQHRAYQIIGDAVREAIANNLRNDLAATLRNQGCAVPIALTDADIEQVI